MAHGFEVATEGALLKGEHFGEGDAIVFLHAGVADRRMWQAQLAEFGKTRHVVSFDFRGFGQTKTEDEPFSHLEDLKAVIDHLEIQTACFVGSSLGGKVAIDFALTAPERVQSLVLLAPAVSGAPSPEGFPPVIQELMEALERAEEKGDLNRANEIEANIWLDGPANPARRVEGEVRDLFLEMNGQALMQPELRFERMADPAWSKLENMEPPALVLWGALDFPHIRERCKILLHRLPGASGEEISDAAHLLNLERSESVNSLIREFLV